MPDHITSAIALAQAGLRHRADPERASGMQAYMKTDMPFYGVQKPARVEILRAVTRGLELVDRADYERFVLGLWELPHREEKYLALAAARHYRRFVDTQSLPLYERLIVEGAWWDFVDEIATRLVGHLVVESPAAAWPVVEPWIESPDLWLRRSAIICQVGAKQRTDSRRLFGFCEATFVEKEFFIRKAIGWSLREYSKTDPDSVAEFVDRHRDRLSGLSYREATRHLGDRVG